MTLESVRQEVAVGSRILAEQRILDAFGHVSRRNPSSPSSFLISRSLAPALVAPSDVIELDLDGEPLTGGSPKLFLERFIHAEIYRRRPDVQAIVHSHAPAVLPFTIVPTANVRPACHMCGFLQGVSEPFDIADHAGSASDLLIRDARLGAALAAHLGDAAIVLMRGHGFTAVGNGVPQATYRAIYTARNCEIQLAAAQLGEPVFLTDAEARTCDATSASQLDRAWDLWRSAISDDFSNEETKP
jgi:ribulose-5-phosphate 4-epimerase/fuculose-1-phosphate aldolase